MDLTALHGRMLPDVRAAADRLGCGAVSAVLCVAWQQCTAEDGFESIWGPSGVLLWM
jgi:hypothetical protein